MEACKIYGTSKPRTHAQGLKGKEISSPSSQREKNALTLPLIDHDISPTLKKGCKISEVLLAVPQSSISFRI